MWLVLQTLSINEIQITMYKYSIIKKRNSNKSEFFFMYAVSKKIETYCFGETVIRKNYSKFAMEIESSVSA